MVLKVDGWSFAEFPRRVSMEAYQKAREEFVRYYESIERVHAIYRFGSITYPGLSDLDFIVVLEDDYHYRAGTKYGIDQFSPDSRSVLYHWQFFVPRRVFAQVPLLEPIFEMEHVAGHVCPQPQVPPEIRRLADTLFVCESLVTDLAVTLLVYWAHRTVHLRMAQARLKLLAKNARIVEALVGQTIPGVSEFEQTVTELRRDWFSRPPRENCVRTKDRLGKARDVISSLSSVADRYARRLDAFPRLTPNRSKWVYRHGPLRIFFSPLYSTLSSELFTSGRRINLFSPLGLLLPLIWLSSGRGRLSQYIRNQFETDPPQTDLSSNNTLRDIVEAANYHCDFLKMKGIPTRNFRFYGYHPDYSPGIRTFIRILARKVRWFG